MAYNRVSQFFKKVLAFFQTKKSGKKRAESVKRKESTNQPKKSDTNTGSNEEDEKTQRAIRTWNKEGNPERQLILWGFDKQGQPGFLSLYGTHEFEGQENRTYGACSTLEEDVIYTSYMIWNGKEGHLPSFEAVKIKQTPNYYDRKNENEYPKMFYKKAFSGRYYYRMDPKDQVMEFSKLEPMHHISVPYFKELSYEQISKKVKESGVDFDGFKIVQFPNEILGLSGELSQYINILTQICIHQNLYMRKKMLKQLMDMNPPQEVYKIIYKMGSCELISGLFMELAKSQNFVLLEEAKILTESEINWTSQTYGDGLKRCAHIYINALDQKKSEQRKQWILETVENLDSHMDQIRENEFNVKFVLQEAEIFGLAKAVGTLAYYLDSPTMIRYLRSGDNGSKCKYLQRYARRIIDSYGKNDSKTFDGEKYITAMKNLFINYKNGDFLSIYYNNFQSNQFISRYLYHDYVENEPSGWYERYVWRREDQFLKLEGRYEFQKEIWDEHLDVAVEIAMASQVQVVVKACYYMLKESKNRDTTIGNLTIKQLIQLSTHSYQPLATMFEEILNDRLNASESFDIQLMMELISYNDPKIKALAMTYFDRTNGAFSPKDIGNLLFLHNIADWVEMFEKNVAGLSGKSYVAFLMNIINEAASFAKIKHKITEELQEILTISTKELNNLEENDKKDIMKEMIGVFQSDEELPTWLREFMKDIIFTFSYEELGDLLMEIRFEPQQKPIPSSHKQIISLLEAIHNNQIPNDAQIVGILDEGTSKMMKILFEIIINNREQLKDRFSTLLIMLEARATNLHREACEVFEELPEDKQKKMHGMMIDSPVEKVYSFGLTKLDQIYGNTIPEEFILQMLEHTSLKVKEYIADKINQAMESFDQSNEAIFLYYAKTVLMVPNKGAKSKVLIYGMMPKYVKMNQHRVSEVEQMLLDIGGSNIKKDSEKALVALAKIRMEGM